MASHMPAMILVVEDDPGIAALEKDRLQEAGYLVCVAATADAALAELRRGGIDLILLDYRLPGGVDGLDFYARVRATGADVPVILVTGFSSEATVIQALRAGVRDFVTKSVEYLDYLPDAVDRVLRQVRLENQLAESEARLASVIASARDAIIVADARRRISLFNPAAERMFRCPAAEAIGQSLTRFIPDEPDATDGGDRPEGSLTHRLRSGNRGVRADGEVFPLEASVARPNISGRKLYTVIVRDITEWVRAEQALREGEERFRLVTRATNDVIWDWDLQRDLLWVSEMVGPAFGYAVGDDRVDIHWWIERIHPEDRDRVVAGIRAAIEQCYATDAVPAAANGQQWSDEYRFRRADGSYAHVLDRGYIVCDTAGRPVRMIGAMTDVTERKRLEVQYLHAQRMESIGTLAGGVAHDFNNLLTVINGYSELLLETVNPDDPSRSILLEIRKAGERAAALTRQLLTFSRKQVTTPQVFDLNKLVAGIATMLRRLIGENIELVTRLNPAEVRVKADPGNVEQVVVNLAVNARDAMPGGGRLTIETRTVTLGPDYARSHVGVRPGPYVLLAVADTGHGMDAATAVRIFEPFFTTKSVGKGTGLGLSTVHGIVTQAGGHIDVRSEPGQGTTFEVYLPRVDTAEAGDSGLSAFRVARGTETVLLTEDEDGVRQLARVALQANDYTVLEAASGEEALRVAGEHGGPIHLLVTDVVMPRMSGRELAGQLAQTRRGLKVLYLSGYTDDTVVRHGDTGSGTAFLQKPFTPTVLARKVREVLDAQPGRSPESE